MAEPPAAAPTDEDRLAGVLVGTAIGDALGLPTENLSPRRLAKLFPPPLRHRFLPGTGMVSDDTEHAALSALSLLDAPDDPRAFARQLAWRLRFWLASLPAGVGMATARACIRLWLGFSPEKSGVFSGGNGPSMRLRAVSTEAFWAEPLASLEAHLARGASVHELASALGLSRGVTGYSMHSVPVALYAWLRHRPDFPAALDAAICCGGDTDSVGAGGGLAPQWVLAPTGITANQLAVLVNSQDPQSVAVAAAYQQRRGLPPENVIALSFPVAAVMSVSDFQMARATVAARMDGGIQAFALSWTIPYRVDCMSAVTAFATLSFDAGAYCSTPCATTATVTSYNSESHRPWDDHRIRPTMMLAAGDAGAALALIDRGVAADDTFPTGDVYLVRTADTARSVRYPDFRATASSWADGGLTIRYVDNLADGGATTITDAGNVLGYLTGLVTVPGIATNSYLPGAVADHLTSVGGQVPTSGQMSILRWLEAGATASYGTVVEPCNYTGKFPAASVLWAHYYRGEPIIEAYWKSVAMPGEGNFIGEPLARPWGAQVSAWSASTQTLGLTTTALVPGVVYTVESAGDPSGPWTFVRTVSTPRHDRVTVTVQPATARYYRLRR